MADDRGGIENRLKVIDRATALQGKLHDKAVVIRTGHRVRHIPAVRILDRKTGAVHAAPCLRQVFHVGQCHIWVKPVVKVDDFLMSLCMISVFPEQRSAIGRGRTRDHRRRATSTIFDINGRARRIDSACKPKADEQHKSHQSLPASHSNRVSILIAQPGGYRLVTYSAAHNLPKTPPKCKGSSLARPHVEELHKPIRWSSEAGRAAHLSICIR